MNGHLQLRNVDVEFSNRSQQWTGVSRQPLRLRVSGPPIQVPVTRGSQIVQTRCGKTLPELNAVAPSSNLTGLQGPRRFCLALGTDELRGKTHVLAAPHFPEHGPVDAERPAIPQLDVEAHIFAGNHQIVPGSYVDHHGRGVEKCGPHQAGTDRESLCERRGGISEPPNLPEGVLQDHVGPSQRGRGPAGLDSVKRGTSFLNRQSIRLDGAPNRGSGVPWKPFHEAGQRSVDAGEDTRVGVDPADTTLYQLKPSRAIAKRLCRSHLLRAVLAPALHSELVV